MLLDTVRLTIQKHRMLRAGDRVLVGVSGGPDSLALLSTLVSLSPELRLQLRVCYVDHGLRPAAARREAALVKKMGRLWGVPVDVVVRKVRKEGGQSLEASARRVRYEALAGLAKRRRCRVIALAHTRDDQAETVLMWILRGSGTAGLAGMPPVREKIIRPLIDCSRKEVEDLLKLQGVRALKDHSNDSSRFLRNRIRKQLLPLLERQYNPQVRRHLAQLAEILRQDMDWLGALARAGFHRTARVGHQWVHLNRAQLRSAPVALRKGVLKLAVERLRGDRHGFDVRHWTALDLLLSNGTDKPLDLPHGLRAEAPDGRSLILRRVL